MNASLIRRHKSNRTKFLFAIVLFLVVSTSFSQKGLQNKELPEWRKYLNKVYFMMFTDSYASKLKLDSMMRDAKDRKDKEKIAHTEEVHGLVYLFQNNESSALSVFKKSENYFEAIKDYISLGEYESRKAIIIFNKLKFKEAEKHFLKSIEWMDLQDNKDYVASICYRLGTLYTFDNRQGEAIKMYAKGLKISEATGNKTLIFEGNLKIGTAMLSMTSDEKTGHYLTTANQFALDLKDSVAIANSYYALSNFYQQNKQDALALLSAQKALNHMQYKVNSPLFGNLAAMMSGILISANKPDSALLFAKRALEQALQDQNKTGVLGARTNIAKAYLLKNEPAKAKEELNSSWDIIRDLGFSATVADAYKVLSEAEFMLKETTQAYDHLNIYIKIHDSIFSSDSKKQIANVEATFQNEKKQMEIESLSKDKALQEEQISMQNKQKLLMSAGLVIALGFSIFIYRGYKQKKKDNIIIREQALKMEEQKKVVEQRNKEVMDSINYAKRLQEAILPGPFEIASTFKEAFIFYEPKEIVAGDFYWFAKNNGYVFLAVCDCTGHGVPGAMLSVVGHNGLHRCVNEFGLTDPGQILDKLSYIIEETFTHNIKNVRDGMDISLVSFKLKGEDNVNVSSSLSYGTRNEGSAEEIEVKWAGANNPLWYIDRNGSFTEITADKQPVGKHENRKPFKTHSFTLKDSDCLYFFSDGYADQFGGPKGKKFKYSKFRELLLKNHHLDMQTQLGILDNQFTEWKGDLEQLDDVCVIGIRV